MCVFRTVSSPFAKIKNKETTGVRVVKTLKKKVITQKGKSQVIKTKKKQIEKKMKSFAPHTSWFLAFKFLPFGPKFREA
jgi:hypothetical protein